MPIEFAPSTRVNAHADLLKDFLRQVFDMGRAFVSDESSLWDFHSEISNANIFSKIWEVYGVDVSDIESGNLADILERISTSSSKTTR
jgi:hypothetical protein